MFDKQITAIADRLRTEKKIDAQLPAQACLDIFAALEACNERAQRPRTIAFCLLLGAVICALLGAAYSSPLTGIGAAAFAVAGIVLFAGNLRWTAPKIVPSFVIPALKIFRDDTAPDTPVDFSLDFRGPTHSSKAGAVTSPPELLNRPRVTGAKQTMYTDPVLSLSAKLVDKSSLRLTVTDYSRVRRITKRNPRGKYKTKSKTKARRVTAVRVRRNPETTFVAPADKTGPPPVPVKIKIAGGAPVPTATASISTLVAKGGPKTPETITNFTDLTAAAFAATQQS